MPTPIDRLTALLDDGNAALDRGDLDGARPLLHHAHDWVAWSDEADADGSRRAPHFDEMCTTFDRSNG